MNREDGIILIIEDDANLNELIADKVMESGFINKSCMSGNDALIWLKTNVPLFMFLDYSLSDYTGQEFIHELEAQHIKVPPFVVATGRGDEMIAVEMMKLGARDYIIKDTSFLDKIGVITKHLSKEIENEKRYIQIENELKESNEFSKQIIEGVKEGIVVYDKQLNILVWNPFMEKLTGYKSTDLAGKNITEVVPNLEKSKIIENLKLALEDKVNEINELEFYFEFPETEKSSWVSEMSSPLKNSDAEIIGAISTIRDMTERKKAENDLRESEKKFRILFAENPQPMWVYDLQSLNILEVNDATLHHYGYSRDEFLALSIIQLHPKDFIPEFMEMINKRRMGIKTDKISKHVKKNGEVVYVEVHSNHVRSFGESARLVMINDITVRKIAEDKLKNSLSLLNATIESTTDGIMVIDKNDEISVCNSKFLEMWNMQENMLNEKSTDEIMKSVSLQTINPEYFISSTIETNQVPDATSKDIIEFIDGRVLERYSVPQYIDNKIVGRVWSMRDITERINAEREIRQKIEEMTRFHKLTVGRELVMIDLKKEINELYRKLGEKEKYVIVGGK